jgi:phosphomannomutase
VAYLARRWKRIGIAVTPSHNAVGYVGLKGFTSAGRLFDREWRSVRDAYGEVARGYERKGLPHHERGPVAAVGTTRQLHAEYLKHVTQGLESDLSVVLDTRGGATAAGAPAALRRIGARVVEMQKGFSPTFFGGSPEPRPDTLRALSHRVTSTGATVGFAFDGDGDRCVILDERGRRVEPEVIALLLYRSFANPRSPIVASLDASKVLDRHARILRSRVGGRFVTRAMRARGAEVGVEPSGHYYVRRYGVDSDGILVACLVAHALAARRESLSTLTREFGRIYRGTLTTDFASMADARHAFRNIVRDLGKRARPGLEGVTVRFPEGGCLVRRSNTQPSIRFAYEAARAGSLRRLEAAVRRLGRFPAAHSRSPPPGTVGHRKRS